MNKILVIQNAFTGDVILATGVIETLHKKYPKSKIDFLLRKGNESLLKNHPFIGETFVWNKQKNKYKSLYHLLKEIRKNKYDLVVNLQRFASSGLLTAFSNAKVKIGFDKNPFSFLFSKSFSHSLESGLHETQRNHALIAEFCGSEIIPPALYPSEKDYEKISLLLSKHQCTNNYVCLAPASIWFTKQLPEESWVKLLIDLSKKVKTIFLIGAPSDKNLCERILKNASIENAENLCGELTLLQSAALMKQAKMNYTNDSAPLHMASAMHAPLKAFFCSTLPSFGFGPIHANAETIETKEKLSCRPCGIHGKRSCPENHFKCGTTIQLNDATGI